MAVRTYSREHEIASDVKVGARLRLDTQLGRVDRRVCTPRGEFRVGCVWTREREVGWCDEYRFR